MIIFEIPAFFPEYYYISYSLILVGVALTVLGGWIKVRQVKGDGWNLKPFAGIAIAGFGLVLSCAIGISNFTQNQRHEHLYSQYKAKSYEVAEGVVKVLREQPKEGHAPGDLILIAVKEFDVSYSPNATTYRTPISHGGALKHGVNAKVYYINNDILKVEIL